MKPKAKTDIWENVTFAGVRESSGEHWYRVLENETHQEIAQLYKHRGPYPNKPMVKAAPYGWRLVFSDRFKMHLRNRQVRYVTANLSRAKKVASASWTEIISNGGHV